MRSLLAGSLLILACAAEARAQAGDRIFCATLERLLSAARERPAFASLGRSGPTRAAAGLGFDACRIENGLYGNRLVCSSVPNPHRPPGPEPEAAIPRCLPRALRMSEPEGSRLARFRLGTLALHVERLPGSVRLRLLALPVER